MESEPSSSVLEEDTSRSLAATLRLAKAKGYIEKDTKRQATATSSSSKKAKLEIKAFTVEEKRDNDHGGDRGRHGYRHQQHNSRGPRGAQLREVKERDDYKPDIKLEYTDDAGRKLETPKEAYRYMCYKFHGKGPGKNKIDKRLRKQEIESKIKESLSTDVPSSANLMISKQKELQTPFIVLSKGK